MDQRRTGRRLDPATSWPIHRQRLAEPPVLERQVAQELERVVAPGTAERLVHHAAEQSSSRRLAPSRYQRSARRIEPVAVDLARLRRHLGDAAVAKPPAVHVEQELVGRVRARLILGQLRDLVAVAIDDPLIDVDRLGPLAVPRVVGRVAEQALGVVARIGDKLDPLRPGPWARTPSPSRIIPRRPARRPTTHNRTAWPDAGPTDPTRSGAAHVPPSPPRVPRRGRPGQRSYTLPANSRDDAIDPARRNPSWSGFAA